jgi:hypothetical protein
MIVAVDIETSRVTLEEPDDFGSLKVVARGGRSADSLAEALGASGRVEDEHVFLAASAIEGWAGAPGPDWIASFRAMLAAVERFGWYDPATDEVRAHLEWG